MEKIDLTTLLAPLDGILKPGRYLGGEWNQPPAAELEKRPRRLVLCYPDLYELGMSHLGLKILQTAVGNLEQWACERVFMPAIDLNSRLRERNLPLFSLETHRPVRTADVLGITLQTETTYTNVLEILELAGIPLEAKDRDQTFPLILGGGSGAFHAEPMALFFDLFLLGDGEEALPQLLQKIDQLGDLSRPELLLALDQAFPWIYVPAHFLAEYDQDDCLITTSPCTPQTAPVVESAWVDNLDQAPFPCAPMLPWIESTHDRITIEIMRGCLHGCRFCQAGMERRPLRFRSRKRILELARETYRKTGYDQVSLLSLSASDHPELRAVMADLRTDLGPEKVSVSLPSLRVDKELCWLPEAVGEVRKSTLTLAPEAGTDRLRAVINKDITTADLLTGAKEAWQQGWRGLKLYFMLGLPTETDADIAAIAELAHEVSGMRREFGGGPGKVNISLSTFVPRPWTPFQWEALDTPAEILRKQQLLLDCLRMKSVKVRFRHPERSLLEATLCRGDRRLAPVIKEAHRLGAKLEGWDEHFDWSLWLQAFANCNLDPASQGLGALPVDSTLPWDHLRCGVTREWLTAEREKSRRAEITTVCTSAGCHQCGHDPQDCHRLRKTE